MLAFMKNFLTASIGLGCSPRGPTSPPPNRDEGRPPPPPPSSCANAGIATKSAAKTQIHRFIRSPLEIESQSGFDLTRLACSARFAEVRGCHGTAEAIQ